jgi:hypothetical protein
MGLYFKVKHARTHIYTQMTVERQPDVTNWIFGLGSLGFGALAYYYQILSLS